VNSQNPYQSPTQRAKEQPGTLSLPFSYSSVLILIGVGLLAVMLISQHLFKRYIQSIEIELPYLTKIALGPIVPSIVVLLTLGTIFTRIVIGKTTRGELWTATIMAAFGFLFGYYMIALLMCFVTV
jgi:hypothetical protein